MSFVDKLKGTSNKVKKGDLVENDNMLSGDPISKSDSDKEDCEPLCRIVEDPTCNLPSFSFSEKMKKRLFKDWNRAVIVKLLGRNIGYKLLLSILQSL
ncbi:hypothetical protein QN277_024606 [Acacia crassicarpa]|uniref:Uncharacterized protein n=1 Tax=Acacia crassicarpa TaxID=499986 RepID=A0AAE1MP93_9FABA|nr:hypothetical protein QN277_024606 [Acacia crassicarpa]